MNSKKAPLRAIKSAVVKSLPIGLRKTSENGREFFSKYFIHYRGEFRPAVKMLKRSYVKVIVLGDQRPYTIEVSVINERRNRAIESMDYKATGTDKSMAGKFIRLIKQNLSKRRKEINFIDDFRIF